MQRRSLVCVAVLGSAGVGAASPMVLAAEDNWYPYSAERKGKPVGLSVDIVRAAYRAAQVPIKFDVVPYNRGLHFSKAGGMYVGVFNGTPSESDRRNFLIPKHAIAVTEQVVIGRVGEVFKDPGSFAGRQLSLTLGYTYPQAILDDKQIKLERAVSDLNNLRKIGVQRADFTIIDRLVATWLMNAHPELGGKLEVVGTIESQLLFVFFAKTKAGAEAMAAFDRGMALITAAGELAAIRADWARQIEASPAAVAVKT